MCLSTGAGVILKDVNPPVKSFLPVSAYSAAFSYVCTICIGQWGAPVRTGGGPYTISNYHEALVVKCRQARLYALDGEAGHAKLLRIQATFLPSITLICAKLRVTCEPDVVLCALIGPAPTFTLLPDSPSDMVLIVKGCESSASNAKPDDVTDPVPNGVPRPGRHPKRKRRKDSVVTETTPVLSMYTPAAAIINDNAEAFVANVCTSIVENVNGSNGSALPEGLLELVSRLSDNATKQQQEATKQQRARAAVEHSRATATIAVARERTRRVTLSLSRRLRVASDQRWHCNHCEEILNHCFEVDHIRPRAEGGSDTGENLQAHLRKGCVQNQQLRRPCLSNGSK
jgi:hypothetical protein